MYSVRRKQNSSYYIPTGKKVLNSTNIIYNQHKDYYRSGLHIDNFSKTNHYGVLQDPIIHLFNPKLKIVSTLHLDEAIQQIINPKWYTYIDGDFIWNFRYIGGFISKVKIHLHLLQPTPLKLFPIKINKGKDVSFNFM